MKREVKPISDFPGYFISNYGEVYTTWDRSAGSGNGHAGHTDSPMRRLVAIPASGRFVVGLSKNKQRHVIRIHRLVLEAFVGPCPPNMEACHFPDRDTSNNRLDNLRWDTRASNEADKIVHGTSNQGERNGSAKLTDRKVKAILIQRSAGAMYREIAEKYKVSLSTIQWICSGTAWKHIKRD